MTSLPFTQQVGDNILRIVSENIKSEIKRLNDSGIDIHPSTGSNILSTAHVHIARNIQNLRFNQETSTILKEAIEYAVDNIPVLNKEASNTVLNLFHLFDAKYKKPRPKTKKSKAEIKVPVLFPGFLVNIGISKKLEESCRNEFIIKTVDHSYESKGFNEVPFTEDFFVGVSLADQKEWLHHVVNLSMDCMNDPNKRAWSLYHWLHAKFDLHVDHAIKTENRDFCTDLLVYTLEFELDKTQTKKCTDRLEFKDKERVDAVYKLRNYMFGDEEEFKRVFNLAESLDCFRDRSFWLGASLKSTSLELQDVTLGTIEFK